MWDEVINTDVAITTIKLGRRYPRNRTDGGMKNVDDFIKKNSDEVELDSFCLKKKARLYIQDLGFRSLSSRLSVSI